MNGTAVNPTVSMRLTHDEFVRFVANHSNHFTSEAGKRIAGELAEGSQYGFATLRKITCHKHGDTCTAVYDAGFYVVRTDAYADADAAWRDVYADLPSECGCWNGRNLGSCMHRTDVQS